MEEELSTSLFLCKYNDRTFVSDVRYDEVLGYYVDDIRRKKVITVTDLTEFYLIES